MAKNYDAIFGKEKMTHQPGKGFLDGYTDRKNSIPNKSLLDETNDSYWREYNLGWTEADRRINEGKNDNRDLLLG